MARTKASEHQRSLRARTKADLLEDARRYQLLYHAQRHHLKTYRRQMEQQRLKDLDVYGQLHYIPTLSTSATSVIQPSAL
jgi:hypothetical protein